VECRFLRRQGLALVVLGLAALGGPGCDSAPCMEAADKIQSCLDQLDCRDVDPTDFSKCNTAQTKGRDALNQLRSAPCTLDVKDIAEQINSCPITQVPFCNCVS